MEPISLFFTIKKSEPNRKSYFILGEPVLIPDKFKFCQYLPDTKCLISTDFRLDQKLRKKKNE